MDKNRENRILNGQKTLTQQHVSEDFGRYKKYGPQIVI